LWPPPRRGPSAWGGRGLEGISEASLDRTFEEDAVEYQADGSAVDAEVSVGRQELSREWERIANAQPDHGVELPGEREVQEGRVGDAA
jgi:hypothetical protein